MKKFKWSIMSLAIIFSVCAAFATRPKFDCSQAQQYYKVGASYAPAGTYGLDYLCEAGSTTCTYYTTNGGISYTSCALGSYTPGGFTRNPATNPLTTTPTH